MTNGQGVASTFSGSKDYSGGLGSGTGKNDVTSDYIDCGDKTNSTKTWSKVDKIVSVKCVSKDASLGCARDSFSKKYMADIETDQITIYDKNGNYKKCDVDVYLDKTYPTLKINVYKAGADGKKTGSAIATTTAKNGDPNKSLNITYDAVDGWLNYSKYPYGIVIEASYSNTSPIRSLFIAENNKLIFDSSDPNYGIMIGNTTDPNKKSDSFSFTMADEGIRIWKMMVTDSVGYSSSVTLTFKMDKSLPVCNLTQDNTGDWTKDDVAIKLSCSDPNSSGCVQENYDKTYNGNDTVEKGSVEISDKAGNKRTCEFRVKHDKQAPSCGDNTGSTSWTNSDRTVSVDCNETSGSGCKKSSYSNTYTSTKTTDNITIYDKVGNYRNCPVNVYVDKTAPTFNGCDLSSHNYSGRVTIGSKWTENESGLTSSRARMEYCYRVLCGGGTNSCTSKQNNFWLRSDEIQLASDKTKVWSLGGYMNLEGNTYYGVISSSCATLSGQKVDVYFRVCDNAGNCGYSGKKTYNYKSSSC